MPENTDNADPKKARSEAVVEAYRRHKLARSALRRVRDLIAEFDESRAADARLARAGIIALLLLLGLALIFFLSGERITLS